MLMPPLVWATVDAASATAAAKGGLGSAKNLLASKQTRADGMLKFTPDLIHKPLCRLEAATQDKKQQVLMPHDAPHLHHSLHQTSLQVSAMCHATPQALLSKEALGQFRNLLGWLGLKKATYADALAEEFLRYGGANPHMRGELYVMIMKQLTVRRF